VRTRNSLDLAPVKSGLKQKGDKIARPVCLFRRPRLGYTRWEAAHPWSGGDKKTNS
jgi:hypothetical protein